MKIKIPDEGVQMATKYMKKSCIFNSDHLFVYMLNQQTEICSNLKRIMKS